MKTFKGIFSFVIITAVLLSTYSCKKDTHDKDGIALVKISTVQVSHVESNNNYRTLNDMPHSGLIDQVKEISFNEDYNLVLSLKPISQVQKAQGATRGSSVLSPMEAGVRYRVLVFNTDNSYVDQKEFIVGKEGNTTGFELKPGSYRFVAYSFNNSTAIPEVAPSPLDGLSLSNISTSSALLYMNREVAVQGGENLLGLVLKHRFSNIILSMEAASELGRISTVKASIIGEPSVTMSLLDGTLTHPNTPSPVMFDFPILNLSSVTSTPTMITNAETAKLELKILEIALNDGPIRTDLANITDLVIRPGVQYQLTLTIQSTGITVGGNVWAKGNLAYVNGVYFNRSNPEETGYAYHASDYWNFASAESPLLPAMNMPEDYFVGLEAIAPKIPDVIQDPCRLVAGNNWRMPTLADFAALGNFTVINSAGVVGSFDGGQPNGAKTGFAYIYFNGVQAGSGEAEQLRFYKTGRKRFTVSNNISVNDAAHNFNDTDAHYMAIDGTQGVASANKNWQVHMPMIVDKVSGNTRNMLYYRLNDPYFSRDDRVPIRCVKSK
ncbi:hypothetical protein [Sphingobacterium hotanense]|uniref:hypothetical protein n=1 Tax=Sphingobacterium hotanense TaxID=649196 RepID=UPI0021A597E1|nr:hypothetical protein [Sphingobacterium hotanense]MCT1523207.1 hypothetical protein [Sphingobacterium hotanense]